MANVARFMCALASDATLWETWKGKLPVIINAASQYASVVSPSPLLAGSAGPQV